MSVQRGSQGLARVGVTTIVSILLLGAGTPAWARAPIVTPHLSHRAQVDGSVRVIVRLAVPMVAEGRLADRASVHGQRRAIAQAQNAVLAALGRTGHRLVHRYGTLPFLAIEVTPGPLATLNRLAGLIARVEEDALDAPMLAESVPLVHADIAWTNGFTGAGQVVVILDTGVDGNHPFLAGKVLEEACYSANRNCPNGQTSQTGPGAGVPCTYAVNCRHGTHVAGIAAGSGAALSGVARGASLMAVQVFSRFTGAICVGAGEDPCTLSYTSDQLAGLERVYALRNTHAIAAVNMSFGGGGATSQCDSDPRKAAIDNLRSVGIATVIAAGNNGFTDALSAPACVSSAISVGSTDDGSLGTVADAVSGFSNSASFLSLLAPGRWINSSVPGGAFANFQGTSMAAPHVAGAWALVKQAKPSATVSELLALLSLTGVSVPDPRSGLVKPRIRAIEALQALTSGPAPASKTFTVTPCRLVDTRQAGGAIPASGSRSFLAAGFLAGQGGAAHCGIPAGSARAVFVNVVAVAPEGPGHLTIHAYPMAAPVVSTLNFAAGQTVANGVLTPICNGTGVWCVFDLTVTMGPAATHVVIDVTGYVGPGP
jgi:subtilisin